MHIVYDTWIDSYYSRYYLIRTYIAILGPSIDRTFHKKDNLICMPTYPLAIPEINEHVT